ncbi:hypothetical protein AZ039_004077 [Enterobacter kobei]|nr:hypothetical protein L368_03847 [Enterobacter sp. MGH 22]OUF23367.1 hypothetical protein AZ039_004077 [Enterobacter kobei]
MGEALKESRVAAAPYPAYILHRIFPSISCCRKAASYEIPGSLHK